jgi:general secretion pathway protein F
MVEAGEASGNLEVVLVRLAEFTESQLKLKNKISGAMVYPILMIVIGFGMMGAIFIFVIPQIAKIFKSMKKELPLQTKIVIQISEFLQNYWYMVLIGIVVAFFLVRKFLASEKGTSLWHSVQLKIPILGELIKMINVSRFCSTLATLLNSGVPILTAMNIVRNLIPNIHMRAAIEEAKVSVAEGGSLVTSLKASGHYPPMVTHMISLGEKSGELEDMLGIVANNYEDQVENKIAGLTSLLEPLMMVGMGLAVAFIVMAVVVPMMDMTSIKR